MAAGGSAALRPLFFGSQDAPLFGCFHAAAAGRPPRGGVVLCQPVGHEYMVCHRAMRQLAIRLAQSGLPVLRFDFTGTGDSFGEPAEALPVRWVRDVGHAVGEARAHAGDVSLAGLRLGATIALAHAQQAAAPGVRNLVLWDPVVDGRAYVEEQTALHRERFGGRSTGDVLGFPMTAELRSQLEEIDLVKAGRPAAARVLIVETGTSRDGTRALEERLRAGGAAVEYRSMNAPAVWQEQPNQAIVPAAVIQAIVTWMRDA